MKHLILSGCFWAIATVVLGGCGTPGSKSGGSGPHTWRPLSDGKTMSGWVQTPFEDGGKVQVQDGAFWIHAGDPLSGMHRPSLEGLETSDYEVEFEAQRAEGYDFFCALTFPVGKDFCTLVMGGWGGGVTGLSSLGGFDAANNDTSVWFNYENGRWYQVRLRVTRTRIGAWIDGEPVVDAAVSGRKIGIRIEVEPSRPFGIATFSTTGGIRNIRIRKMKPDKAKRYAADVPGETAPLKTP